MWELRTVVLPLISNHFTKSIVLYVILNFSETKPQRTGREVPTSGGVAEGPCDQEEEQGK